MVKYQAPRYGPTKRKRGEIPRYWWDFQWEGDKILNIIIETDDPRVENGIVGVIPYGRGSILKAESVVMDLKAGRSIR